MRRKVTVSVASLVAAAFIAVTFAVGMSTGYGWGYDGGGGTVSFWAGWNTSYCFVNFTERDAACETAQ